MRAEKASAVELIGRSRELKTIARGLERSRTDSAPILIRVVGDAGVGKSALMAAAAESARRGGWIVASGRSYEMQSQLPLSALRQLLNGLLQAVGDERARYATGLEALFVSPEPESAERAFMRLVEGVALDRAVAFLLDDTQWADRDSLQVLYDTLATLASSPVIAIVATRPQSGYAPLEPEITVRLQPLQEEHAKALARRVIPNAPDEIVDTVVRYARGYPLDIVSLSTSVAQVDRPSVEDVAASRRAAIAREVEAAAPDVREFLQVCSLVDGPIGYRLLEQLWPDLGKLDALVEIAVKRLLRLTELGLEFDHALLAESVRHTIAVPNAYRRRIIDALERLESKTLEELHTLAEQRAACGDRTGAFTIFAGVAEKAAAAGQTRLTVSASERALDFAEPRPEEAITFFPAYADALFTVDRDAEAIAVLERALRLFEAAAVPIPGPAVGRLILAQSFTDQLESAKATYARFLPKMRGDADRAFVISAAIWFAVCGADLELADTLQTALLELRDLPFQVRIRMRNFRAFVLALHGRHGEAMALLDEAGQIADEEARWGKVGITIAQRNVPRLFVNSWQFGTRVLEPLIDERKRMAADPELTAADEYFLSLVDFLRGNWSAFEARAAGVIDNAAHATPKRRLLGLAAAVAAFRESRSPYHKAIEGDVAVYLSGQRHGWLAPVAAWWAVANAKAEPQTATAILSHLIAHRDEPSDPHVYFPAIAPVLLAHRLRDDASLSLLSSKPRWVPQTPWHKSHDGIARGIAANLIGLRSDVDLPAAITIARELGLNVYADLAAALQKKRDPEAISRLAGLGVKWLGVSSTPIKASFVKPTARELQVAALVAEGKSNQEISTILVLSLRTVEAHVSNLFNKTGATSRTQLVTWYLREYSGSRDAAENGTQGETSVSPL